MARSPEDDMQMIRSEASKLTYEDYVAIPADGLRHEIIEGEHIVSPAPRTRHQIVLGAIQFRLWQLVEDGQATVLTAPIDVHLTEHDIVQPDLAAISADRGAIVGEKKVDGAPDLVIEIVSPSTGRRDRGTKRALYEEVGVREYWIVDPEVDAIEQLVLDGPRFSSRYVTGGELASAAFPAFVVQLADVFRRA